MGRLVAEPFTRKEAFFVGALLGSFLEGGMMNGDQKLEILSLSVYAVVFFFSFAPHKILIESKYISRLIYV